MATDLNPEVPEFVPTFVTSVPQPIKEEEVRFQLWGSQSTYRSRDEIVGVYLPSQLKRTVHCNFVSDGNGVGVHPPPSPAGLIFPS